MNFLLRDVSKLYFHQKYCDLYMQFFSHLSDTNLFCIHLIISLFRHCRSTQRNCCGSSSFWRSFWRGLGRAVVSHLQHVQACCPSWLTQCARGPSETCWWCQLASPMTALLRETTIVSSWWVSGWRRWQQRCFFFLIMPQKTNKKIHRKINYLDFEFVTEENICISGGRAKHVLTQTASAVSL